MIITSWLTNKVTSILIVLSFDNTTNVLTSFAPSTSFTTPLTKFCIVSLDINNLPFSFCINIPLSILSSFFEFDEKKMTGSYVRLPERTELSAEINESLIVEFYNR